MSKDTGIEWTDHTFNPWWGCTKVSPGCDHCYADTLSTRWGMKIWGADADRRFFGDKHWADPLRWNADAEKAGERRRVFCGSMCDWAEGRPDQADARARLFDLIETTPWLDWQLLTKRPGAIKHLIPTHWLEQPRQNVWFGTSTENQEQADRRIPQLLAVPAVVRFLSAEPLLGPVDLRRYLGRWEVLDETSPSGKTLFRCRSCGRVSQTPDKRCHPLSPGGGCSPWDGKGIHWVITGGESGPGARPCHPDWVRGLRDQCVAAGVAYHFKQWGEFAPYDGQTKNAVYLVRGNGEYEKTGLLYAVRDEECMERVGKKAAGRVLDGATWSEFPVVAQEGRE